MVSSLSKFIIVSLILYMKSSYIIVLIRNLQRNRNNKIDRYLNKQRDGDEIDLYLLEIEVVERERERDKRQGE